MAATIMDVAERAGVSKSTVSLVLNGSSRVRPATRERVQRAIAALDYTPNLCARTLSTRRNGILGVISLREPGPAGYGFAAEPDVYANDITRGVPEGLRETDYGLLTECCRAGEPGDFALPDIVRLRRADGVILIGNLRAERMIAAIRAQGMPLVFVGGPRNDIDTVYADAGEGAAMQLAALRARGHRNLCFINCPTAFSTNRLRRQAIDAFLSGRDAPPVRVTDAPTNAGEGGYRAMRALWESGLRPDGVAAANEQITLGALRFLYEKRVRVPEETSVIAYESSWLGGYCTPALTTLDIRKEYIGRRAAELLLRRIAQPDLPPESVVVHPALVPGGTLRDRRK